jgi:hypothetical protein
VKVKLSGWPELERALAEELPRATARNTMTRAMREACEPLRQRMAELAPYDPLDRDGDGNHLNETMRTQPAKAGLARKLGTERKAGVVLLTGPGPIGKVARANASWQEFGTVKQAAQPYARPAADSEGEKVVANLREALVQQIDKAKARIARKAAKGAR